MIVDSSALVTVLMGEPGHERYFEAMYAGMPTISAATYLETGIVIDARHDPVLSREVETLLLRLGVEIAPVTESQARLARAAYRDFGRGSGHRAGLNYGDCFSYALAVDRGEPLLFVGDDFTHTDVRSALA